MTREEAIKLFRRDIECLSHDKCSDCILEKACDPMKTPPDSEYIEAYGMAIKALSAEPSIASASEWCRQHGYVMMPESVYEQDITKAYFEGQNAEPCDDAISRADTIEWLKKVTVTDGITFETGFKQILADIQNMPPVTPKQKMGRWIPVRDRLPKPFSYVNCTCHSLVDDREDWVVETCYLPQPPDSPYSDWGNIPMLNWGECEVIAWMYRDISEPYKAESEDTE